MMLVTEKIAHGDYTARVSISSQDEIGRLAASFNRMADSLQRVEQLRKTMVVDIAHELRSPLTNMRGYLEALRDGVLPPSTKTIELLHEETLRLAHLAEDLLQLTEADAAHANLRPEQIELQPLIVQNLSLFQAQFDAKEIGVETEFGDKVDKVMADPHKLAQIMHNLLQNAWQYTPHGGRVRIFVERLAGEIQMSITNTGDGISEKDLPFIFERFYRGEKSRSRNLGGAGIGLAIVKELVEAHGGRVRAESWPDQTRISFTLPA
jgi:signal transduction histidine kinase